MNEKYLARITWLSEKDGGRKTLPQGNDYAPIIVLKDKEFSLHEPNWSLFVKNVEIINDLETIAEIKYLSKSAPNNLRSGIEFKLYEGAKKVAYGKIL